MKFGLVIGIACAFMLHAAIMLFGRVLFARPDESQSKSQQVELLSADDAAEEKKPDEPTPETPDETEELAVEEEQPPDAAEMMRNLELSAVASAPELDAASLSAIEAALSGQVGAGGDFAQALDFSSGGRIGGTGKASGQESSVDSAFSIAEIDQKPRAILQGAPLYPSSMRGKKVEAVVTVLFVVDSDGKVANPRVESSTNPVFEAPALDAVRKWKFEPGVRAGQRVPCKMRIPIRFPPS